MFANQAGAPGFKERGWANCHINPVLLFVPVGLARFDAWNLMDALDGSIVYLVNDLM